MPDCKLVVHPPSNLFANLKSLYRPGSIHDTDRIIYRCFLPDLTRFVTVCCVVSDQNGLSIPNIRVLDGNSAPHQADFGKRAPLAPRLAQPIIRIRHLNTFLQVKMTSFNQVQPRIRLAQAKRPVCSGRLAIVVSQK